MSRVIKFRAWDKAYKWMFTPEQLDKVLQQPEMFDVMQYIGLKDKNGVEIYEGDVVRYNTGETWFVEWDAKQSGFMYMNRQVVDESGRKKPSGIGYGQLPGSHEVEVIGNIYENPELACQHVDFEEMLVGRRCNDCGLETES